MQIAERTLQDLGYSQVLQALAARCRTDPGKARAARRPFLEAPSEVDDALTLIDEARRLLAEPLSLPLTGVSELTEPLERASKGAMLEPRELIAVTHALFSFERTREALEDRRESLPSLAAIGRRIPDLEQLATRLDRSFEPSGEIADRASPALKEARDRTRGLHRSIKARIDKLLQDEKFAVNLRDQYFSIRNDRYVLPVLAQHRAEVPGIVHNASQTGQTLFIEPQEMIGLGNDLAIAQSLVLEEERRLLQELSEQVGRHAKEILEGIEASAQLDEAEAAGRLANELLAHRPELEPESGPLDLKELRHPLLALGGKAVVGNDVRLEEAVRSLVISGPNAGGKTVTLTAVGLAALMLRAGLPICADPGSRLPLFRSVHSAVGDAQDLAQGLSTFSAHVVELREIASAVGAGSLALIDEIAADTDPREGAAIAIAVLEDLIGRGAVVLVTTHLEELKALAHMDRRFVNARVGFDPRKMAPTYRLQLGASGSSSAIDVAARMGLSADICRRARELAIGAGGPLSKALHAAEEERRKLSEAAEAARVDAEAARQARLRYEHEERELTQRRKEEELKFREGLTAELEFARGQIRALLEQLKAKESAKALAATQVELTQRIAEQAQAAEAARVALHRSQAPSGPPPLHVGARVHHTGLGKDVEILEVDEDEAVVLAGALRLRAKISLLTPPKQAQVAAPKRFPNADRKEAQRRAAEEAAPAELKPPSATCDVRGMRAEEALRDVEQFLDRVYQGGEESALILHGHGTGALKQSIREYLGHSPYVQGFRPGGAHEGGDGVTVIGLKG